MRQTCQGQTEQEGRVSLSYIISSNGLSFQMLSDNYVSALSALKKMEIFLTKILSKHGLRMR